jgi:hypothetical protein
MIVKRRLLALIMTVALASCNYEHDPKALRALYNREPYDTAVMDHLALYDSLKDVLVSNLDTIFKFRDARTPVYHGSGADSGRVTYAHQPDYLFYYNWDSTAKLYDNCIGEGTLPAFVLPTFERIFEALGRDRIQGFEVWHDSSIEIQLAKGYIDAHTKATVRKQLRWKIMIDQSDWPYIKDTVLAPGWTYEIAITEDDEP